jgi:hypothetical protein
MSVRTVQYALGELVRDHWICCPDGDVGTPRGYKPNKLFGIRYHIHPFCSPCEDYPPVPLQRGKPRIPKAGPDSKQPATGAGATGCTGSCDAEPVQNDAEPVQKTTGAGAKNDVAYKEELRIRTTNENPPPPRSEQPLRAREGGSETSGVFGGGGGPESEKKQPLPKEPETALARVSGPASFTDEDTAAFRALQALMTSRGGEEVVLDGNVRVQLKSILEQQAYRPAHLAFVWGKKRHKAKDQTIGLLFYDAKHFHGAACNTTFPACWACQDSGSWRDGSYCDCAAGVARQPSCMRCNDTGLLQGAGIACDCPRGESLEPVVNAEKERAAQAERERAARASEEKSANEQYESLRKQGRCTFCMKSTEDSPKKTCIACEGSGDLYHDNKKAKRR